MTNKTKEVNSETAITGKVNINFVKDVTLSIDRGVSTDKVMINDNR